MNVTASLMGDPIPGRSALDQRNNPPLSQETSRKGIGGGAPRLTPSIVRRVRESNEPLAVLARRYGVSVSAIKDVRYQRSWKHV